jgi:hypothetical protein
MLSTYLLCDCLDVPVIGSAAAPQDFDAEVIMQPNDGFGKFVRLGTVQIFQTIQFFGAFGRCICLQTDFKASSNVIF